MHRAFLCAVILSLVSLSFGTTPPETFLDRAAQIRSYMETSDLADAERAVKKVQSSDPANFKSHNFGYLLGRLLQQRGSVDEARASYQEVISGNSQLAPYAKWRLSQIARSENDLSSERKLLLGLLNSPGVPSRLADYADDRLTDNYMQSGDYKAAISRLQSAASGRGSGGREAMALLGRAYLALNDRASARSVFTRLESASRDDYSLEAALGLDRLDKLDGTTPDQFERIRRARIYIENRHWAEARTQFSAVARDFPGNPNLAEAIYQTGYAYFREDKFDEAVRWFDRAHSEFPSTKEGQHGYYWVGTALQKAGRYMDAAKRYQDFIQTYPNSDYAGRAYLNIIDCYRYAGKNPLAIRWAKQMEQTFAGQGYAGVGLFDEAKIALADGDFGSAITLLSRVQAASMSPRQLGAPGRGEVDYLKAVALELAGNLREAVDLYLAIPDERSNYFGHRASMRLAALSGTNAGRKIIEPVERAYRDQSKRALSEGRFSEAKNAANQALRLALTDEDRKGLLETLKVCYGNLPSYSAVFNYRLDNSLKNLTDDYASPQSRKLLSSAFLFLGLYDDAADELLGTGSRAARSGRQAYGLSAFDLAVVATLGDRADYAISFGEPLLGSIPEDFQLALMPRELAGMIYPAPYRSALIRTCSRLQVDPRFVLSLARQESRFNARVKSPASARGLMQLIPETARLVATESGIKDFELEDAYSPEVALQLGTRYVKDLMQEFPGNMYAVAAGYNTDEDNVKRWVARANSSDVDRFVAEVPLPETKDYIAKVMNNYWAYQQLYDRNLRPGN